MKITEVQHRSETLIQQLLSVWESSVKATHLFLSENEIADIKRYVPQALAEVQRLLIIETETHIPVGFLGVNNQHLEMLFVADTERGKGYGKKLLNYGIETYSINDLAC